ncbi:hypothetical protein [Streptomyces sp. NPDC058249]|uniref:hypothetical protein n=1 Tax=Streptomyces sp. NPDC058249 TaxID=3346403 RepID=UPI0036E9598B
MIERATGSWETILNTPSGNTLKTLTVSDGDVTAKGSKLDCTGTLKPGKTDGKETPTLTLSCKSGSDGGRGKGTLHMRGEDALALDWKGPVGGWGGPVDSFRRTGSWGSRRYAHPLRGILPRSHLRR